VPPLGRENFDGSLRVAKIFSEPSAGACAARGCAQVTADENRKARSENKSMFFTERSAAEFISGDTDGGRPPGRRPAIELRDGLTLSRAISLSGELSVGSRLCSRFGVAVWGLRELQCGSGMWVPWESIQLG